MRFQVNTASNNNQSVKKIKVPPTVARSKLGEGPVKKSKKFLIIAQRVTDNTNNIGIKETLIFFFNFKRKIVTTKSASPASSWFVVPKSFQSASPAGFFFPSCSISKNAKNPIAIQAIRLETYLFPTKV